MLVNFKNYDGLKFRIFETRKDMGTFVAERVVQAINTLLETKEKVRIIFACAPSQAEFLEEFVKADIDWGKIESFHMDEYVGLSDPKNGFAEFIKENLTTKVPIKKAHYIDPSTKESRESYIKAITSKPIDIVCLGIGENGHLAFNDPGYAKFDDQEVLKEVQLDDVCRQQQVNDGCFPEFDAVPKSALTLTIPILLAPKYMFCTVPGVTKKAILEKLIVSPVTEEIPCTIMKTRGNCWIYTDQKINETGE